MTFVTSREGKFEEKNVKQIVVHDEDIQDVMGNLFNSSVISILQKSFEILPKICVNCLQALVDYENSKNETMNYDFIIISEVNAECFFGYLYESKVKRLSRKHCIKCLYNWSLAYLAETTTVQRFNIIL